MGVRYTKKCSSRGQKRKLEIINVNNWCFYAADSTFTNKETFAPLSGYYLIDICHF